MKIAELGKKTLGHILAANNKLQAACDRAELRCFGMSMENKLDELTQDAKARVAAYILKKHLDKVEKEEQK